MRRLALLLALLFVPLASAQQINLDINGVCREFNVTGIYTNLEKGCYDVKIDVTTKDGRVGEIFDPRLGWKSSFYYINENFCTEANLVNVHKYRMKADTDYGLLNFIVTLRNSTGEQTWNSGYIEYTQDCRNYQEEIDFNIFLLAVFVVVLLIIAGITAYVKIFR